MEMILFYCLRPEGVFLSEPQIFPIYSFSMEGFKKKKKKSKSKSKLL